MKTRTAMALLVGSWIVYWLVWHTPPKTVAPAASTNTVAPRLPLRGQAGGKVTAAASGLTKAGEMAVFISRVVEGVPVEQASTRTHLRGLQAYFFASDYVMASKTNQGLPLSKSAMTAAFGNAVPDTAALSYALDMWAVRPGTLADHYRCISELPSEKDHIAAIRAALTANGLRVDTEGDLLMDCIRYAGHCTDAKEIFGPNPRNLAEAMPSPVAFEWWTKTGDAVFAHRFNAKHGLDAGTVEKLMAQLRDVRIYDLSPADLQIPTAQPLRP